MIIEAPITFAAWVRIGTQRNAREVKILETVPLLIREVNSADAPIVGTVVDPYYEKANVRGPLRKIGPHFYHRFAVPTGPDSYIVPTVDDVQKLADDAVIANTFEAPWDHKVGRSGAIKGLDSIENLRVVERTTRAARLEEAEARAAKLIVIDGAIYKESEEPKLELGAADYDGVLGAKFDVRHYSAGQHRYYRADRAIELIERLEADFGELPAAARARALARCPVIERPDLLDFEDEWYAIRHALDTFVRSVFGALPSASRDTLVAFADLRDLTKILEKDDVATAVDRAAAAIELLETDGLAGENTNIMSAAIERWRKHQTSLEDARALEFHL